MRLAVLIQGTLRGMGREEKCELLATKVIVAAAARPVYSHCAVIEAPCDLPDGEYEVEFGGEVAWTQRHNGSWTGGQTLPKPAGEVSSFLQAGNGPMGRPKAGLEQLSRGAASRPSSTTTRK